MSKGRRHREGEDRERGGENVPSTEENDKLIHELLRVIVDVLPSTLPDDEHLSQVLHTERSKRDETVLSALANLDEARSIGWISRETYSFGSDMTLEPVVVSTLLLADLAVPSKSAESFGFRRVRHGLPVERKTGVRNVDCRMRKGG
jgi:hypothetical protein